MSQQTDKPLYQEYHEGFRRLLILGSIPLVIGLFFGDKLGASEVFPWIGEWYPTVMWAMGLMLLSYCFLLNPKQYVIYEDSVAVEWWYPRRKAVPFDEITELKIWSAVGKKGLMVLSRGPAPGYKFGCDTLTPREIEAFARRLEEAVNRRRFQNVRDPISVQMESLHIGRKKGKT